jgi:hypothetical protein
MTKMPASVAEIHEGLTPIVFTAHCRWKLTVQLFGSIDRVKLLYDLADHLFDQVKQTLISDVVLKLCQLTDGPRTGSHENLSLYRLRDVVDVDEPGLAAKLNLDTMLHEMCQFCLNIREMRNRLIAHRDWGRRAMPSPVTNKDEIEQALNLTSQIMNAVQLHFDNGTSIYEPYPGSADGDRLISHLQRYVNLQGETEGG